MNADVREANRTVTESGLTPGTATAAVVYNAFISYSHAADGALAPALRDGLQRFATPWRVFRWINPVRSLRIFQDQASLSANPALWPTIEHALSSADWFILLASPEAALSPWVAKEVEYWRTNRPVERFLIVQTDGEISWNSAANDFDWALTTALPKQLVNAFELEPRWINARWAHSAAQANLRDPRFRDLVAELAAPLRGVPKDELIGEDIRQYHRLNHWRNAALGALSVLLIGALTGAGIAARQRNLAEGRLTAAQRNQSRAFAALAEIEATTASPAVAVRAALAGVPPILEKPDRAHVLEAELATLQGLRQLHELRRIGTGDSVTSVAFSPDGRTVATGSAGTTARLWDVATGKELTTLQGTKFFAFSVSFSPDGRTLATLGSIDDTVRLWELSTGREIAACPGASVAFSPDGRMIATGSRRQDNTARIWDATTGKELAILRGHKASARMVAFSPDGTKVLTTSLDAVSRRYDGSKVMDPSDDITARLWDAASGKPLAVLRGHEDMVNSAVFSPDGSKVLTASWDGTARLWDPASGKQLSVLRHEAQLSFAAFSPDGKKTLTASPDHTVRLWNAAGNEVATLRHEGDVHAVGFSPDGRMVVTASGWDPDARSGDNAVRLWDATSGREISALRGDETPVRSVAFNHDGQMLATVSEDGTARLWETRAGIPVRAGGDSGGAVFSPDGSKVLTASYDATAKAYTARLWRADTGSELVRLRGRQGANSSAVFSPDGSHVLTIGVDHSVRLWDAAIGKELAVLLGHEAKVVTAVISPDGTKVLTAAEDGTARLWVAASGKQVSVLRHEVDVAPPAHKGGVVSAVISPDGTKVLTRELTASKDARLWDAASGKQLAVLRHGDQVSSAVFNRDGKKVLTASDDQTARLWDAGTGKELRALTGHEGRLSSAVFSPSGAKVLTTSLDHTTRLWDAASGKSLVVLHHGQESVDAIFSPDGRKVLTVSEKAPARIWDAESGKELGSLRGHSYEPKASAFALDGQTVATIAFSPDGRTVVTGSADHTARLWDAESGRELSVLRHEGWVNAVAFSPDGGTLATVSAGVHLWPLGQHLIDRACARVHDLPLSDENKKRLGIEEWCTPEISGALRDRLRQYQASGRPPQ